MQLQDFTKGEVIKQLLFFSWPIMLTNLLQVSYQFIDSLWVGNLLGANALGAVTISSTVVMTVLSFIIGINNAALTILSQQKGKKDVHGLKDLFKCLCCCSRYIIDSRWNHWLPIFRANTGTFKYTCRHDGRSECLLTN